MMESLMNVLFPIPHMLEMADIHHLMDSFKLLKLHFSLPELIVKLHCCEGMCFTYAYPRGDHADNHIHQLLGKSSFVPQTEWYCSSGGTLYSFPCCTYIFIQLVKWSKLYRGSYVALSAPLIHLSNHTVEETDHHHMMVKQSIRKLALKLLQWIPNHHWWH